MTYRKSLRRAKEKRCLRYQHVSLNSTYLEGRNNFPHSTRVFLVHNSPIAYG